MAIIKKKTKSMSNEQKIYQEKIFKNYHESKQSHFIPNESFINQVLLVANLSKKSSIWKTFYEKGYENFLANNEIQFQKFILGFERDLRFSLNNLVPNISQTPNSKILTFNFSKVENELEQDFLNKFNNILFDLLENGYHVEIFPNVILLFDKNLDKLTVLFSEEFLKDAR
ncbi:MSC_0623 family F1-like ATPase-associated protein [Mycoplasmopsis glycophila]|uniref:Protein of uncharacterized function (DUF2714) n=1 Tax=Mycoplasmopsis glycophila TaxID=171285 RepID=A0A449AUL5_9BACT|nr:DUF2714 domain-containing protein [Mycoplasmopsis glycophila]VEU70201.1 Protein of uncharacterised function (DUF2714) [Mycoplasmopsis glycophila]